MSYIVSSKAAGLVPYEPSAGEWEVRLDANESFLPLSEAARRRMSEAIAAVPCNRYPDPAAADVCRRYAAFYGWDPACLTAGNGSDELISVIVNAFLQKGERAVVVSPDFSMYAFYLALAEVECVTVPKTRDWQIPVGFLLSRLQETGARMVLFSNPCNPTGQGLPVEAVETLVRGTDALVVLDEAYMDFWDESQSLAARVNEFDNLIVLRTCSKMMGLAALRLGFALACPALTRVLRAAKSPYNVNSLTQRAAAALLAEPQELHVARQAVLTAKVALEKAAFALPLRQGEFFVPTCTNFLVLMSPRAGTLYDGLKARSILVRRFDGFLRITVGSDSENARLIAALDELLRQDG